MANICYRCGQTAGNTKEHVVPRCFYPLRPNAQLVTVPACRSCNEQLSPDEEYLRTVLTSSNVRNRSAYAVWQQKVMPWLEREEFDGLRTSLVANMRDVYLPSPGGFMRSGLLKLDAARMDRVAEKIVRGMYYHITGNAMPLTTTMKLYWQPKNWPPHEITLSWQRIDVDPDVFSCCYAMGTKASTEFSIWWMVFYRSFVYVVTVLNKASSPVAVASISP